MIGWLEKLKERSSWLFYLVLLLLLLPIIGTVIVSVFSPLVRSYLFSSVNRLMSKTKKKDEELKEEISQVQKQIDSVDQAIDEIDVMLEENKSSSDEDWHKNMKGKK